MTNIYTFFLFVNAFLFTGMFVIAAKALLKNHLLHRVRILMWGSAVFTLFQAHDNWGRAFMRLFQIITRSFTAEVFKEYTLFSMIMVTFGTAALTFALEYVVWYGEKGEEAVLRHTAEAVDPSPDV
jgi:hypothetical protein